MESERHTPRHWLLRRTPTDIPFWIIVFQTVLSLAISPLPQVSLRAVWPHAAGLMLYALIVRWPWTGRQLRWAWWALVLGGAGMGVVTLFAVDTVSKTLRGLPGAGMLSEIIGRSFNPNVIAGYLVLLSPFSLARALEAPPAQGRDTSTLLRLIAGLVWCASMACLWLTGSRAGLAAGVVGAALLLVLRWPRVALRVAPILIVAGAALAWRVNWAQAGDALLAAGTVGGLDVRMEIWSRALYIAQDFAFTGLGFGCFEPVVELMYPLFLVRAGTTTHAHNLFLQVAVDLGLPGLVAYLSLLGLTGYMLLRASRATTATPGAQTLGTMSRACLAAGLGMLLHGLLDSAAWGNKGAAIPWVVLALAVPLFERAVFRQGNSEGAPR